MPSKDIVFKECRIIILKYISSSVHELIITRIPYSNISKTLKIITHGIDLLGRKRAQATNRLVHLPLQQKTQ